MALVYDNTNSMWVEDGIGPTGVAGSVPPSTTSSAPAPAAPTGTNYNIGSGSYNVGNINLNDTNQLMSAGLTAAQRTTPAYQPLVTGYPSPLGQVQQELTNTLYDRAFNPSLQPQTTFGYQSINPTAPGNIQGQAPVANNRSLPTQKQATGSYAPQMATTNPAYYDAMYGQAAQGQVSANDLYNATYMNAAQSGVDPRSTYQAAQMRAAQMQHTPEMDVQNQFNELMQGSDLDGNSVPDWAQTAVTQENQRAAGMGLGNSTMALNATSTAIFNTALPMAEMNAQTAYNIAATNTANVQQANMANTAAINASRTYNATVFANTQALNAQLLQQANMANAQYANDASKYNASVYAQMGLQNLLNQQQTMLSNQAAENARRQFNATSDQQNNQFFSSLNAGINSQNADRANAIEQFNAGQYNSMVQFYDNMNAQLDMFNAQNQLIVDQSNVQWQRTVNTANTAGINSANNANVQNMFNMSQTDMNLLWQQARDEASWALTSAENSQNRLLSLTNSALNRETSLEIMNNQQKSAMFSSLGGLAANLLTPVVSSVSSSLFGSDSSGSSSFPGEIDFGGGGELEIA